MNFCIFNQQRLRADGTQNTATSPMLQRCIAIYLQEKKVMRAAGGQHKISERKRIEEEEKGLTVSGAQER